MKIKNPQKRKQTDRQKRHLRVRARVFGTAVRPRLAVFRSAKHLFVQLIDDEARRTIASASDHDVHEEKAGGKVGKALAIGEVVAERAKKAGITEAVFDRGGYTYHGRVRAVADGARAGGLKF